jgi:acyl-CoA synthetase (AMP-forming)/AMP-acid ligase II
MIQITKFRQQSSSALGAPTVPQPTHALTEPLALVPLAVAAHGGHVDDLEAQQLVAAGLTLLRRCAPLVRAFMARRAAILLPTGPAYLTALAAAEGRGALLLDPAIGPGELARQLESANAGAVLTLAAYEHLLPDAMPRVRLDDAPAHAMFIGGDGRRVVDLGSHVGLAIEGEADAPGRDEEAVLVSPPNADASAATSLTHRELLSDARAIAATAHLTSADHALAMLPLAHRFGLTTSLVAPLLAGARVTTMAAFQPPRALEVIQSGGVTFLAGLAESYTALLTALEERGHGWSASALRVCICGGAPPSDTLRERWLDATGVELTRAPVE